MIRIYVLLILITLNGRILAQNTGVMEVDKPFLLGKIQYSQDERFKKLPSSICTKENAYLLTTVADSLFSMVSAAKKEGIVFKVISASRNFDQQKAIWEKKWLARKSQFPNELARAKNILLYSSMPGTSRHHWGTDFDLNSLDPKYFQSSKGKTEYQWLLDNAERFGFYQPYNNDPQRTGYNEEKWHWSFFPFGDLFTQAYEQNIQYNDISPFKGCNLAQGLNIIQEYVLGIQPPPIKKN